MKKRIITVICCLIMVLSSGVTAFADDFSSWGSNGAYPSDVSGTAFFKPVKFLMDKKIITGNDDGLFHADRSITRAEFATIIAKATNNVNMLDEYAKEDIFSDLNGYSWAKPYINTCAKVGIINGVGDGKFAPEKNVSYAEAITILIRMKSANAVNVGTWPYNYIEYAQGNLNTVIGDRNITDWNAPATRGDIVTMLYRMMPK